MSPPVAESADTIADTIAYIGERLSDVERDRFELEWFDARRDPESIRRLFRSWLLTIEVRDHPAYEPQYKEFVRMIETGDGFAGIDQSDPSFPKAL